MSIVLSAAIFLRSPAVGSGSHTKEPDPPRRQNRVPANQRQLFSVATVKVQIQVGIRDNWRKFGTRSDGPESAWNLLGPTAEPNRALMKVLGATFRVGGYMLGQIEGNKSGNTLRRYSPSCRGQNQLREI